MSDYVVKAFLTCYLSWYVYPVARGWPQFIHVSPSHPVAKKLLFALTLLDPGPLYACLDEWIAFFTKLEIYTFLVFWRGRGGLRSLVIFYWQFGFGHRWNLARFLGAGIKTPVGRLKRNISVNKYVTLTWSSIRLWKMPWLCLYWMYDKCIYRKFDGYPDQGIGWIWSDLWCSELHFLFKQILPDFTRPKRRHGP